MKSIIKYISIVFDLLEPQPSFDRISLQMVRFSMPEVAAAKKADLLSIIPKDYLYYNVHEIEDETWNYAVSVNSDISQDIRI